MKRIITSVFTILALIVVTACGSSGSGSTAGGGKETYTLSFNSAFPNQENPEDPQFAATKKFAQLVEERTNGRVKIELYYNNQLVGQAEAIDALQDKTIDLQNTTPNAWADRVPEGGFTTLSFMGMGEDHLRHLLRETEFGALYEEALGEYGVKPLIFWPSAISGFMSTSPIASKEDFKGLVINSSDKFTSDFLSSMGAGVANIPYADTYEALQRGTVDAITWGYNALHKYKYHEVVDYISAAPHLYPQMGMIAMSKATWDSLPKDIQDVIDAASKEMETESFELSKHMGALAIKFAKENGVELVGMTEEDMNELIQYAEETQWAAFANVNGRTAKMIDILKEVNDQWLKDHPDARAQLK